MEKTLVLSPFSTFVWGVVGALLAYLPLFVLPVLVAKTEGKPVHVSFPWLIVLIIVYMLGGGLFAVIVGDATSPKHAAFSGVGWESAFKGVGEGARLLGRAIKK